LFLLSKEEEGRERELALTAGETWYRMSVTRTGGDRRGFVERERENKQGIERSVRVLEHSPIEKITCPHREGRNVISRHFLF
jgi:hypothetical protein